MTHAVSLVEACEDRRLFGLEPWPKQRELLEAVERGPRLHVWALGRRAGKTTMAAAVGLHGCLFRPDLDERMRPGERRYAVVVATNQAQARLLVAAARSMVEGSPMLSELVASSTEDELRFTNGTALAAFPCSSRGGRGWPISHLVMDEAAHFLTETDGYQTAERVWAALMPSTAQFGDGARVIVSSTPYGNEGLFAQLYHQAAGGELPDAAAHHAATAEVNPTIDAAFLQREERRDPDNFRGEYLAEFLTSGNAYLDFDRFTIAERGELQPDQARSWVAGLDPAFARDPFGIALVGIDKDDSKRLLLGRVDALKASRLPGGFDRKLGEVIELLRPYRPNKVVTDQYAAPAVIDRLQDAGFIVEAVHLSAQNKTAAFAELRARLYDGTFELYQHEGLVAELRRLRTRFTVGQAAVENPRVGGSHGDQAMALALAVDHIGRIGSGEVTTMPADQLPPGLRGLWSGRGGTGSIADPPIYKRIGADPNHPRHDKWAKHNLCNCPRHRAEREALEGR